MAHSFVKLLTHMIFGTKRRKPYIADEIRAELFAYMGGIIRELDGKPIIVNGMIDHVHLLVGMPADVLRVLKTNSSRWVHEGWPHRTEFAWQSGYGLFSVSESNRQKLFQYIQTQEEHHKTVSF
ncbi:MAG: IS200/IS605 family transposase, partial [Candidatus Hydrogenedentes bacterium]|nr:IS200/IS605 family transposase [Candidatus Hydrogenedentota bacterium]